MRNRLTTCSSPLRVPRTTKAAHPEWAFIPNATFIVRSHLAEVIESAGSQRRVSSRTILEAEPGPTGRYVADEERGQIRQEMHL